MSDAMLLGVDTCGPSGSVALARLAKGKIAMLGQTELVGRSYSATLVAAVGDLLSRNGISLRQLDAMVAVNGPGSFTGVRVGLSAVKGLAEPSKIPVLAVSRLEVLAHKAGAPSAALDAHRQEVFLRVVDEGGGIRELLAGRAELSAIGSYPGEIAVCDDGAAQVLREAWPNPDLMPVPPPNASDALEMALPRILARDFVDLALLDGHYLRRSDAEIFGETATTTAPRP
jgi:tRNA threonylcarbamoyladenosine biosynthesis protein TsaB